MLLVFPVIYFQILFPLISVLLLVWVFFVVSPFISF